MTIEADPFSSGEIFIDHSGSIEEGIIIQVLHHGWHDNFMHTEDTLL